MFTMALRKHDSMVVTEIISAFILIGIFSISVALFLIYKELSSQNVLYKELIVTQQKESKQKVTLKDLSPELIKSISQGFIQNEVALKQSNQEIAFFMNKILEKNFTGEEIKSLTEEFQKVRLKQIEEAKAQQKKENNPPSGENVKR